MAKVNPALITIARESRSMKQALLARELHISPSKLSKFENGTLQVAADDLSMLSEALGYTEEFFCQDEEVWGFSSICFYHRKRASMPSTSLRAIQARLNIFRMQVKRLLQGITIETDKTLPHMDVDELGGPDKVARAVRELWKLPFGPIRHLTSTIERAGVIIWKTSFGTQMLDAVSQVVPNSPPVFFMNADTPGDRLRFTLAHELGHVLMHAMPSDRMEEQADQFASELLMPAAEIGTSLRGLGLDRLPGLKAHWRVSMAALIKRAADLEKISPRQYRTLFTELSKSGWRLREPIAVERESPTVLQDIINIHFREHGASVDQIAESAFLRNPEEFRETFLSGHDQSLRVVG